MLIAVAVGERNRALSVDFGVDGEMLLHIAIRGGHQACQIVVWWGRWVGILEEGGEAVHGK